MPPMPSELREALDKAQELIESGKPDDALDILRTTGWKAAQTNSQKVSVTSLASEAMITKGDLDMGNRKKHWQRAYKNYQQALKLESSNKDIRRSMNKLASMMDEQSISLGKGFQIFDDGNPTPTGLVAISVAIMIFLVGFKYAGEALEQPLEGNTVTFEVSYIHPDNPDTRVEGEIVIELYPDDAPKHVENFLYLVDNSRYDYTTFHRIIDGFMVQGGDIEMMNGAGGYAGKWYGYCNGQTPDSTGTPHTSESCRVEDWSVPGEHENGLKHIPGALAAAHAGLNTDGSQFYIVPSDSTPDWLDWSPGKDCAAQGQSCHTVYGMVVSGMEHVDAMSEVAVDSAGGTSSSTPLHDVRLLTAYRS